MTIIETFLKYRNVFEHHNASFKHHETFFSLRYIFKASRCVLSIALSCGVSTVRAYEPVAVPLSCFAHRSRTVIFVLADRPISVQLRVCANGLDPTLITVTTVHFFERGPAQTSGFVGRVPPKQRPTQRACAVTLS